LHISYLPYNRGYDPNIWSFLENTPKGVTIHYMDEGIDSGDILVQKEIVFDESKETLETTYDALQKSIVQLFKENWIKIISGKIEPRKQIGNGTIHYKADQFKFMHLIKEKGWKTPVKDIAGIYAKLERDKSGR
jgi:methionyl-tRNA formyltransferase